MLLNGCGFISTDRLDSTVDNVETARLSVIVGKAGKVGKAQGLAIASGFTAVTLLSVLPNAPALTEESGVVTPNRLPESTEARVALPKSSTFWNSARWASSAVVSTCADWPAKEPNAPPQPGAGEPGTLIPLAELNNGAMTGLWLASR